MQKKILFSLVLLISIIAFSITFTFATDGKTELEKAADSVRNVVGGAENGVENAARNISNTSKNVTGTMENEASNMTNNNNIDSETDIDGIVNALTSRLEEELEYISDGVHE